MRASSVLSGRWIAALLMLLAAQLLLLTPASAQRPAPLPTQGNHIAAELVAEGPAVPGEELTLALLFTPEAGWHGYWSNPGDAGYGMELGWTLPDGWQAGEPQYPVPHRLLISG